MFGILGDLADAVLNVAAPVIEVAIDVTEEIVVPVVEATVDNVVKPVVDTAIDLINL